MAATVTLRMEDDIKERYTALAKKIDRSRSYLINQAVREEIDRLEWEYGILQDVKDIRAGRLETHSLEEVGEMLGLDD